MGPQRLVSLQQQTSVLQRQSSQVSYDTLSISHSHPVHPAFWLAYLPPPSLSSLPSCPPPSSLPPSLPSLPPSLPPSQAAAPELKKQISAKKQEEWDKDIPPVSLGKVIKVNAPEWWLIIIGVLAAMINGSVFPVYSILFGEVLRVFQMPHDQVLDEIDVWAILFLALALASGIAVFFKVSHFIPRSSLSISLFLTLQLLSPLSFPSLSLSFPSRTS